MGIYLNNAATSWPKAEGVADAMRDFLLSRGANLARGAAAERDITTLDMVSSCRSAVAELFEGCVERDPRYATFCGNVTEALNVIIKGFCVPGTRVITTSMEHNSVIRPLRSLEQSRGISVRVLPCNAAGYLEMPVLEEALKEGADLVVMSHASNVSGSIQDLDSIAERCRHYKVPLVLDSAQTAGEIPISMEKLGLSALCFTGHKGIMGPQGMGGILWEPEFAEKVEPLIEGGTGSFSEDEHHPRKLPDKFEGGTPNLPGIAGMLTALEWVKAKGVDHIRQVRHQRGEELLQGLLSLPGCTLYGSQTMENRLPVFALNLEGWDNGMLAYELTERYDIETRPSLHCGPLPHKTLGTFPQGALRISPGYFTTPEEIRICLEALRELAKEKRR
jgi:cysteine desulfurase family protein